MIDIQAYLNRVSYDGPLDVSYETLRGLHLAHTFHVPFENLDIHLGKAISLEPDALFNKLVTARRGGYCFEMNGLFALVLETLGFDVRRLMARILLGFPELRPLTHQALLVTLGDRRWLVDVGNGRNGIVAPLLLEHHTPAQQFSDRFRLSDHDGHRFTLQSEIAGEWLDIYTFTLESYLPVDYVPANFYTSNWPESRFVQHRICTMPTAQGRVTFMDQELKIRVGDDTQLLTCTDDAHYKSLLQTYFGLTISDDFVKPYPQLMSNGAHSPT